VLCALVPGMLIEALFRLPLVWQRLLVPLVSLALLVPIVLTNYERIFVAYPTQYCPRAQNASDIAREMQAWLDQGNDPEHAWIIGYPHWVDTRAVGIWIGDITFDNSVMGAEAVTQLPITRPAWFGLHQYDLAVLRVLQERFPEGRHRLVSGSMCYGREFVVFETEP
jgi:hypothetical protein